MSSSAHVLSLAGLASFSVAVCIYSFRRARQNPISKHPLITTTPATSSKTSQSAFEQLVGETPLVYLGSLSSLAGIRVFGKCEFLNPGGSVKDRVALALVRHAKARGFTGIVEATSGSTGISLAMAGKALNMEVKIFMPNDVAVEKRQLIEALGGDVVLVPPVSFAHPMHMCRQAEKFARENKSFFYTDQFETLINSEAHGISTALEISRELPDLDCFVASSGTGGTIAGVSRVLKASGGVSVILADPQGSALASRVNHGVLFHVNDREGHRTREIKDTITEGVGLNRLTENFKLATIDHAISVSDQEAIIMSRYLLDQEGLFLGSSSAVNLVAVLKAARRGLVSKDARVCTILCDSGQRHVSKFWSPTVVSSMGFKLPSGRVNDSDLDSIRFFCFIFVLTTMWCYTTGVQIVYMVDKQLIISSV